MQGSTGTVRHWDEDGQEWMAGYARMDGLEWILSDRVRVDGVVSMIRQEAGRDGPNDQWNQTRASFGLRYEFGEDPGLRRTRR